MPYKRFSIRPDTIELVRQAEETIQPLFAGLDFSREANSLKILQAMQEAKLSDAHFHWYTGYAYDDPGREVIERIYARVFEAEDALVRPAIASGTHAITLMLSGILRPGDMMLSITGTPYDTLLSVIGTTKKNGSTLIELGITYGEIQLSEDGRFQTDLIREGLALKPKMIYLQRSQGYSFRPTFSLEELAEIVQLIKSESPETIIALDNCYGEFTQAYEPTAVGVDILAGSLIKNPGGGLALSGGYIVGRRDLIELCSHKLTSPGLGKEVGGTFGFTRQLLQGLFFAPTVVENALKSAILTAEVMTRLGYEVFPKVDAERDDIIQAIRLGSAEKVIAYCEEVQKASPVDAFVTPIPWPMPGYDDEVIMAAGTFIQGASIELSADSPMREPYVVYVQGALLYEQGKLALMKAVDRLKALDVV
ncbi:MAG TPA: hypothetical protein GXZ74_04970 [Tissierellia bacterium]|nr:hypothetical protein [Tissierellia bacterium]